MLHELFFLLVWNKSTVFWWFSGFKAYRMSLFRGHKAPEFLNSPLGTHCLSNLTSALFLDYIIIKMPALNSNEQLTHLSQILNPRKTFQKKEPHFINTSIWIFLRIIIYFDCLMKWFLLLLSLKTVFYYYDV